MERPRPMRRLVQGDVGSGKTAVAAAALYKNCRAGFQGALMAPTEILAGQHYKNLQPLLGALGLRVALLTGDTKTAERRELLAALAEGQIDVLVGTHALFSADVEFAALGLAVTDEQHRFGVNQRSALRQKGNLADVLVLTATPIPRTLAMTFCGDLDVSAIDELPPGRQPIQTFAVSYELEARALNFVRGELAKGRQAYIVCPLVEENENLELDSAIKLTERLQAEEFADYRVALLHGKMKPAEKTDVMSRFAAGEIQILVATTVIEVGVDVPNATIMLVRDAERFGLAQLHQLRGRVGRGGEQSYCILLNNAKSKVARERIKTMTETNDGFVIAEADLKLRGAGELLGTRQSGLAALKYADLAKDVRLVEAARRNAMSLLQNEEYLQYPALVREVRRKTELMES
jgi:ATP-dependent DNA helicase RecG